MVLVIAMGKIRQIEKKVKDVEKKDHLEQRGELKSLIMIIVSVIVIFLIFYVITTLINPKKELETNQVIPETIQYEKILVGEMLNRNEKNYYVLVQNEDNIYNDLYIMYLQMYAGKKSDNTYYLVDLADVFNKNYIAAETKVTGNDVSKYQFNDTSLIKISKNKLDKVYTGHETIVATLEKLIK